jgi:4-amino-4-deoxy-L-arabinose transferase-like glycosyltransferase
MPDHEAAPQVLLLRPHAGLSPVRSPTAVWTAVALLFLAGLGLRAFALDLPPAAASAWRIHASRWQPEQSRRFLENDERIYIALVEQLDAGRGYTLQGHGIIEEIGLPAEQYDHPLFYHPPAGVALFWVCHRLFGPAGFALAQLLSFAIFFWSLLLLGRYVLRAGPAPTAPDGSGAGLMALAAVAVVTPIVAHVSGRLWLDGPLVAFATAAAAAFLAGVGRARPSLAVLAGVLLGLASLVKLTAFLVVPGIAALAWTVARPGERGALLRRGLLALAIAGVLQLPWELWQWVVVGSPFPTWAGKPVRALVETNAYVRYVTVVRSPWIYLELLPRVLWTLVPSLAALAVLRRDRATSAPGAACVLWIAVVVGAHVALGMAGYAKLLRLVILVSPAACLLFGVAVSGAASRALRSAGAHRLAAAGLVVFLLAGLATETAQGLRTLLFDNRASDLIVPLTGLPS